MSPRRSSIALRLGPHLRGIEDVRSRRVWQDSAVVEGGRGGSADVRVQPYSLLNVTEVDLTKLEEALGGGCDSKEARLEREGREGRSRQRDLKKRAIIRDDKCAEPG